MKIKTASPFYSLWIVLTLLSTMAFVPKAKAQGEKFDYIFQEAVRQKQAGLFDTALDLYDYCLKLNPESGAVLNELAILYSSINQDSIAVSYLEKASTLYPDNYWYRDHLVRKYFQMRRNDDALAQVEDMAQRFSNKTDVLLMLLDLYNKKEDYANMIKVLDKLEIKEGKSEQVSMEKFQIYLRMNDEKRAFQEIEALAKEYPNDLRYQVLIGDLYHDAGKDKEAMGVYKSVEAKDPHNVSLLLSLSNFYQSQGQDSLYQHYITRLITHPKLDESTRARMMAGLVYENLDKKDADSSMILTLFDKVLELPQETTVIRELLARYMVTKGMPAETIKPHLNQILAIDPESDMARQQLLQYAISEDDEQAIIDVCKPAVEYNAKDPVYYYYLGVAYYKVKQKQEALTAFRQCVDHIDEAGENRTNLLVNSYSLIAEMYHEMGQDDKAYEAYDTVLIYKPNDVIALNNYAYYLSLHKKDLSRAEQMSKKAIELEPNNSTYLDTYAWVLFQLKRYEEAKLYMDKVQELISPDEMEEDSDIRDHIEQINKKVKKK